MCAPVLSQPLVVVLLDVLWLGLPQAGPPSPLLEALRSIPLGVYVILDTVCFISLQRSLGWGADILTLHGTGLTLFVFRTASNAYALKSPRYMHVVRTAHVYAWVLCTTAQPLTGHPPERSRLCAGEYACM